MPYRPLLNIMALAMLGCGPAYVDTDAEYQDARRVPNQLTVTDHVHVETGDLVDWKTITPIGEGEITLQLKVGNVFKGRHGMKGEIAVFTPDANQVAQQRILPNRCVYELGWEGQPNVSYLVRITTLKGGSGYTISYTFEPTHRDPCLGVVCASDEACVSGECLKTMASDGCAGGCPRGEMCHRSRNRCVKDPCYGKRCAKDEVCRRGTCKPRPKRGCDPPCGDDQICKKNRCVDDSPTSLTASVLNIRPREGKPGSVLTLDKGRNHGVRVGMSGKIRRVGSFKIVEVYPSRSKAVISKPPREITRKLATIKL